MPPVVPLLDELLRVVPRNLRVGQHHGEQPAGEDRAGEERAEAPRRRGRTPRSLPSAPPGAQAPSARGARSACRCRRPARSPASRCSPRSPGGRGTGSGTSTTTCIVARPTVLATGEGEENRNATGQLQASTSTSGWSIHRELLSRTVYREQDGLGERAEQRRRGQDRGRDRHPLRATPWSSCKRRRRARPSPRAALELA